MRNLFVTWVLEKMAQDPSIVFVTADLGYGVLDSIQEKFPDRFHNVGAAEQLLLGVGVGLALEGKTPILYTISPFLLLRPIEWIRNYLGHEKIKCMLVGSGLRDDYLDCGFSHWLYDAKALCRMMGINCATPSLESLTFELDEAYFSASSTFIGLRR